MATRRLVLSRLALTGRFRPSPRRMLARAMVLTLLVAGLAVLGAGQALASQVSCGDTITTDTTLHRDLVNCPSNGIVIGADDITLDLNGHTIDGDGEPTEDCADDEICDVGVANDGHTRVTVTGGSVREFGDGILLVSASHNRLRQLSASGNLLRGILIIESSQTRIEGNTITRNGLTTDQAGLVLFTSHHNQIERNRLSRNGDIGLFSVDDTNNNRIADNTFAENPEAGIAMGGSGNQLTGNRLLRNGDGIGIGGEGNTITRNYIADAQTCPEECGFGFGIDVGGGSHNLIAANLVTRTQIGIRIDAFAGTTTDNVLRGNVVRAAALDGIAIGLELGPVTNTLLDRNIAIGAGDDGIDVESASTTLTRNLALHNGDLGIEAVAGVTDGGGNRAAGNGNPAQCTNVNC
jgi:parallel beta-helix repeat protein